MYKIGKLALLAAPVAARLGMKGTKSFSEIDLIVEMPDWLFNSMSEGVSAGVLFRFAQNHSVTKSSVTSKSALELFRVYKEAGVKNDAQLHSQQVKILAELVKMKNARKAKRDASIFSCVRGTYKTSEKDAMESLIRIFKQLGKDEKLRFKQLSPEEKLREKEQEAERATQTLIDANMRLNELEDRLYLCNAQDPQSRKIISDGICGIKPHVEYLTADFERKEKQRKELKLEYNKSKK